ncbi:unnamed protein product [Caretta caretta]
MQAWRRRLHPVLFRVLFLLGFPSALCTSVGCWGWTGLEMKKKGLVRSGKPFKVMVTVVVSFFVCWLLYHGLLIDKDEVLVLVTSAQKSQESESIGNLSSHVFLHP